MSYATLSTFSIALSAEYVEDLPTAEDLAWEDSPFNWIRQEAPGTKGRIGRELARSILESLAITVGSVGTGLTANTVPIRVKLSLEWELEPSSFNRYAMSLLSMSSVLESIQKEFLGGLFHATI